MTCADCTLVATKPITLVDGRVVCNCCPDWLFECDARRIARMSTRVERQAELAAIRGKRGREATDRMQAFLLKHFEALRA